MKTIGLAIWVFITGISLVVALGMLGEIATAPSGSVPGAPLEGVATAIGLAIGLVAAGLFVMCIVVRPPDLGASMPRLMAAVALAVGFAGALKLGLYQTGLYELRVIVVDSNGESLSGVAVSWEGFADGKGIGNYNRPANGAEKTGVDGAIDFVAHHPHRIDVDFKFGDGSTGSIQIDACAPTYGHVVSHSEGIVMRALTKSEPRFKNILIPNYGDVILEITKE